MFLSMSYAQESNKNIFLGLKDNQFGIAGFEYNRWQFGIKQSIFSESIKNQFFQFNLGYNLPLKDYANFTLTPYIGSAYNGNFYTTGANLLSEFYFLNKFTLYAELQPHYDSGTDYSTCYSLGGKFKITDEISLKANFENIPEYRVSEKRVKLGIIFKSNRLSVSPELSIPTENNANKIRVLCSFKYYIKLN